MSNQSLFSAVLGLSSYWRIVDVTLSEREEKFRITVRAKAGAVFPCPLCSRSSPQVGETEQCWLNENFFSRQALLTAIVPVVLCSDCGTHRILTPWERSGSRFRHIAPESRHDDHADAGQSDPFQES